MIFLWHRIKALVIFPEDNCLLNHHEWWFQKIIIFWLFYINTDINQTDKSVNTSICHFYIFVVEQKIDHWSYSSSFDQYNLLSERFRDIADVLKCIHSYLWNTPLLMQIMVYLRYLCLTFELNSEKPPHIIVLFGQDVTYHYVVRSRCKISLCCSVKV